MLVRVFAMELKERPRLKIPKTRFEILFDCITIVIFGLSVVYLISVWAMLPTEVPAHYNATGEVDRWGSKWELIIMPIIAFVMWISLTLLEKYPHLYNYPKLTKENVQAQYKNARLMLNVLKNIIVLLFIYISWNDIQVAFGDSESIGIWFVPFFFILIFGPMIFFFVRSLRL